MDINWVNNIIEELTDKDYQLSNIMLKVKVLASKTKNEKLQEWTNNEINGYKTEVPEYRVIKVGVFGNLVQDRGFGGMQVRQNFPLTLDHLPQDIQDSLHVSHIRGSIADLEEMIKAEGEYSITIPPVIYPKIAKVYCHGWAIETAWQSIPKNQIHGIIAKIKAKLIDFMLEISEMIDQGESISILKGQPKVDQIFDKTIGQIKGDTVNVTIGAENIQSVNMGDHASSNVALGTNIEQSISQEITDEISDFIRLLKENLGKLGLSPEDEEDIGLETERVQKQVQREKPKVSIINSSLKTIESILTGVAANAATPIVLDALAALLSKF